MIFTETKTLKQFYSWPKVVPNASVRDLTLKLFLGPRAFTAGKLTPTSEMLHTDCCSGPQYIFGLPQQNSILRIEIKEHTQPRRAVTLLGFAMKKATRPSHLLSLTHQLGRKTQKTEELESKLYTNVA